MNYLSLDKEYKSIVEDILENKNFMKINDCRHHGITRLEHSLRVSYFSYKISKKLHLNTYEATRAGLSHDYFVNDDLSLKSQKVSAFTHPKKALENASNDYNLSDMEKDIIYSHMFPLVPTRPPKYLESWLVSFVDKGVATYEFSMSFLDKYLFRYQYVMLLFIIFLKRGV